ncbi:MAG: aspartate 1-decarboxylase [Planctomycetaceae bacterium]|nr:aspartate 1-decarboxylase [Planctomycetota bacterium]NUN51594.1 aspartate 1-decarboxylase [Planctomycetaceae bacterium]
MLRTMMKSKIHRATVTDAHLDYVGSLTVDADLLRAVDLLPNEKVHVVNVNTGARFETYIIEGEAGSGTMCANGAAARLVQPGDLVIVIAYGQFEDAEARTFVPKVAFVDGRNRIIPAEKAPSPRRSPARARG